MTCAPRISRRTLLRGAGATLALPWLEAMGAEPGAAGSEPPRRFLLCHGGFSLGCGEDGGDPGPGTLQLEGPGGADYAMPAEAAALQPVRDHVTFVSGLAIPTSGLSSVVPAGGRYGHDDSFHYHFNPLLAGRAQRGDERDTEVTGPSPDQIVADAWAGLTPHRALVYRAQPEAYYYDILVEQGLASYRQLGDRVVPVWPQTSPHQAWLALTGGFLPRDPEVAAARQADLRRRRSVLDRVDRRLDGLLTRLGRADQQRLERHYDEIRALEARLASPVAPTVEACVEPADPGAPPTIEPVGWSGETTRSDDFVELIRFALACDLTRVASLMFTYWKSYMATQYITDFSWTLHDVLHHGHNDQLRPLVAWHMERFATLVQRLHDTPEAGGTLLDHCAIGYLIEGGYGRMAGGTDDVLQSFTSHSSDGMVMLTAGRAGGLVTGQHVVAPEGSTHPGQVMLTLMRAAGLSVPTFGELSGEVPGLRQG